MSKSKSKSAADKQMEDNIAQFCGVTGASTKDAKSYLTKYKRLDVATDMYFTDPNMFRSGSSGGGGGAAAGPSTSKLNALFDRYKEPEGDEIGVDGTIKMCEDLSVDPEDVVLLAVAHELKSPSMGRWERKGWVDGWRAQGTDNIEGMKAALGRMKGKLANDPEYFKKVYAHTFDFARAEGQRSLGIETATAFWQLLLPIGLSGSALAHVASKDDDDDSAMDGEEGWRPEYTDWWFAFLEEKGGKGVSKDTWAMFVEFVTTIDARFEKYDVEAAWPSSIDDFVEYAKERLASGSG